LQGENQGGDDAARKSMARVTARCRGWKQDGMHGQECVDRAELHMETLVHKIVLRTTQCLQGMFFESIVGFLYVRWLTPDLPARREFVNCKDA
jgi:hypothetical protein